MLRLIVAVLIKYVLLQYLGCKLSYSLSFTKKKNKRSFQNEVSKLYRITSLIINNPYQEFL
ncbi:hypothetical protein PanWU01x14_156240 [Parasponia andersonii]|uniref:Uncharacterized protein n=1 Tax=Parasponia andersonii TaxID=3476 RepID=A0A2P5CFY3_PARAD|nr:hypothetical protein PanWU01x14_156240 [Parasponia andersonii]